MAPAAIETFAVYETTQDFYREVATREAMEAYCQWYEAVAQQHQQELKAMQREPNLFHWLGLHRRYPGRIGTARHQVF